MLGRVEPGCDSIRLTKIFCSFKENVNLGNRYNKNLDKENKSSLHKYIISYDYLVLGMGGEANDFGVPGLKKLIYVMVNGRCCAKCVNTFLTVLKALKNMTLKT